MGLKEANRWTANQRRFMEWLATPEEMRMPLTQGGFAKELKVHEVTLSGWKKMPGFMDEVQNMITASLGDVYHDVMEALKRRAKMGHFAHLKLYLEMLGVYTPKTTIDVNIIRKRAQEVADRLGVPVEDVLAQAEKVAADALAGGTL